ncbi:MAG: 1-(5-phosphoribosyl)-5-[(5-phosphoribosylamino)methylideneamino]imidazole-4-carboxamide isomerase [Candidatus Sumerlaeota bacterium]|nr:1-(5-phosphoribosyl)-5-[(5-phosphoribosylamino)methylideneamino]imidazole-4-carboxamide isomerase [Candidatus Sumerlaeota bacterium]
MTSPIMIIPAIDLMRGKCVRLVQGRKDSVVVYSDDPPAMAEKWVQAGAWRLHLIDLDGAFMGNPQNMGMVQKIRRAIPTSVEIEVGGGIRTKTSVTDYLNIGVNYVILGTGAFEDKDFLQSELREHESAIIVGLDARNGLVASHGWTVTEEITAVSFAQELQRMGVKTIIYTDILRDGMLTGPNLTALRDIAQSVDMNIIASGGIHTLEDILKIKSLGLPRVTGIITGKALYEGTLNIGEAIRLLNDPPYDEQE